MEFDADFDAIVTKFSLEILQDSMKNAIVLVLNVEEWRVQNVTCRNGSIITTFRLLPPDEDINDDAIVVFNKDLDTLRGLVAKGDFAVVIGGTDQILVRTNQTIGVDIQETSVTLQSAEDDGGTDKLLPLYITIGVLLGLGLIGLLVYLGIKYNKVTPTWAV